MTPTERRVFVQQLQLFLPGVGGGVWMGARAALYFFYVGCTCSCSLRLSPEVESKLDLNSENRLTRANQSAADQLR